MGEARRVNLELNLADSAILRRILLSYLSRLRTETAGVEMEGAGNPLAEQEKVVERLLSRLEDERPALPDSIRGEYSE